MAARLTTVRYANHPASVARMWHALPAEVQALVRLCDGTRSLTALCDDSGMPAPLLDRVLGRLEADGLVSAIEGVPVATTLPLRALAWLRTSSSSRRRRVVRNVAGG